MTEAFIHVGKTGGSTLCSILRNACHSFVTKPCPQEKKDLSHESYASLLSTYYHIPDFENGELSKHSYDFYILLVRDPLLRTISAFLNEHPKNMIIEKIKKYKLMYEFEQKHFSKNMGKTLFRELKFKYKYMDNETSPYYSCFPTLEIFASLLGGNITANDKSTNTEDCAYIAKTKISGQHRSLSHLFWNYEHIVSLMKQKRNNNTAALLLVRNEFKWEDWVTTNLWLGQKEPITTYPKLFRNRQMDYMPVKNDISKFGKANICKALKKEYSIYFQLLKDSANLSMKDKQESLRVAVENCPNLEFEIDFSSSNIS